MTTTVATGYSLLVSDPEVLGGALSLRSARVPVRQIGVYVREGADLNRIMADYPDLIIEEVAEAMQYYEEHRAEIDAELDAEEADPGAW